MDQWYLTKDRILLLVTGIKVECQESRSQLQNRDTAMRLLRAKIYQWITDQEQEKSDATRKHQVACMPGLYPNHLVLFLVSC